MLDAGHQGFRVFQVFALVAPDHRFGDQAAEIGVFTRSFGDPAPARVARDVHHGGEVPVHAHRRRLQRNRFRHTAYQVHVHGVGQCQRQGENRIFKSVDQVGAEQQGNTVPRFFDSDFLHGANSIELVDTEQTADLPRPYLGVRIVIDERARKYSAAGRQEIKLPDLFHRRSSGSSADL